MDRRIGGGDNCYIIAEAGVNHDGSYEKACALVDAAKAAGADAVKFQTFRAEHLVTRGTARAEYQVINEGRDEDQYEMLKRLELTHDEFRKLAGYCDECGITFLSSPFDKKSIDLLHKLNVPLLKIGSGELTNIPLLKYAAATGVPLVLSTGMATLNEVETAVTAVREGGCSALVLLHCVSNYPADTASVNLRAMHSLRQHFLVPVGFSDHTRGIEIAIGASALGAAVLEKHLTLDRSSQGPDHAASLEPIEFKAMVYAMRNVEKALGDGLKKPVAEERAVAEAARRSLCSACDIAEGTELVPSMVCLRRPGTGLSPSMLNDVIGKRTVCSIKADTMITQDMLQ